MTIWPAIMNVADRKYGGDAFPAADTKAMTTQMANLPNVVGKSYADAKKLLEDIGFTVTDGGDTDSDQPAGLVARTDPAGGSNIPAGGSVTVFKSNASMSAVPGGLTGVPFSTARATLGSAGFGNAAAVCSDPTKTNATTASVVVSSSPASGTVAKRSDQVVLTVTCP